MQGKPFKTDKRLLIYFSVVVFVALWFVPMIPYSDETVRPCMIWLAIFKTPTAQGWSWKDCTQVLNDLPIVLTIILVLSLFLSIPSLVIGWVLQALTVCIRAKKKDDQNIAA
jgi:hypothetical protein